MAELGFEVIGLDDDLRKIASLTRGEVPVHEPGLPELLLKHISTECLRFKTSYEKIGVWAVVHFLGVGTLRKAGEHAADMTYVDAAVLSLAQHITKDSVIVGKSTVTVGAARRLKSLVAENKQGHVSIGFAWNPEFLREGIAVKDTLRPDGLARRFLEPRRN